MNGSRSNPSRPGGSSSLDALSRTIEGLEARIEGLMNNNPRGGRPSQEPRRDFAPENRDFRERDPLAEIRQRQRALEEGRGRPSEPRSQERHNDRTAPAQHFTPQQPPARSQPDASREISQALLGLRQELKHDISESLAAEIGALRSEMRSIRALAEDRRPAEDMRHDIARLADGISELGRYQAPGTERLQAEFEELRSLMDGLAREDSVRHIERRWDDLEERLDGLDPGALRSELLSLADRLDDIKRHLGNIGDHGAIRALEDKLVTVATALEHIGAHIDPSERMLMEQFAGIDMRLDEITRAIAAGTRHSGAGSDTVSIGRIEDRIAGIAQQIEAIAGRAFEHQDPTVDLGHRLEALTSRIEELGTQQTARRLEERLDQLSDMLERGQQGGPQPELTGYLADISRKIDALDQGAVSDRLADRLDVLAERISALVVPAPTGGDLAFRELEQRLNTIVDRLEETAVAPAQDTSALRGLEEQIAHLSTLISSSPSDAAAGNGVVAGRVAALEDYIATSDEYIIEAARQAAETVMESYAHTQATRGDASGADLAALSALADHLKDLESVSRNSEERTHRTFEALHDTLVQIAEKLDQIDNRVSVRDHGPLDGPIAAPATATVGERHAKLEVQPAPVADDMAPPVGISETEEYTFEAPEPEHNSKATPKKAAKPSLLSGLGKRFLPGQKKDNGTPNTRTLVDPSPSIDASEMLPPEEANELLEPGSGAPDVRKILERVRATQAAQRESGNGNGSVSDGDRTDYIAAARRAAQAAASEMDRTYRPGSPKTEALTAGGSTLSRYRRPILMAVGAVLLVAMAMPLVNTLLRSNDPLPVTAELPTGDVSAKQPDAGVDTQTTADASIDGKATAPVLTDDQLEPTSSDAGAAPPAPSALTAPVSLDENSKFTPAAPAKTADLQAAVTISPSAPIQAASAGQAASNAGAADGAPAETIAVPDAIKPASLVIAAKQGDPLALFEVAARYSEGRGVDGDFAEAAKWYKMAADKGFAPAMYRLANLYENGSGVERNVETARHYYELAAEKGNASAMHNLAVMHASGATGTQDYPTAAKWFGKAAEFGVSDSQFNLAILNARGNGVPQNLVESYKWFAIAAKAGDKDAAKKRDEVANVMAPDQLEKARAAVDLWKPQPLDPQANSTDVPDEWAGKGVKTASVDMKKAIRNIQGILNNNGFDAGVPDGVLGEKTVTAIKAFQTSIGMEPTGKVTDKLVKELLARNK
ncbi:peptidoglycan-binding protein [Ciceribacter thiooxidans]|uniref:Peptidoglycan-binding protein n=1 Tax=Ciceribacter thiooxidans TaxID=1969821 RepID=A0ABV7I0B7_9HYPH|nr:peptidoglycan-binding protein [Ciceribacter thiooxidans]